MTSILDFFKDLQDSGHLQEMIRHGGIPVMALIVFAETGLLVGFFLPGDTMLFLAGVMAANHFLNVWWLNIGLALAAIAGDQLGYFLGYEAGPAIFSRKDGRLFKKVYAQRAHDFYVKYGTAAVILARFIPIMRTFVPFMAGVARMDYRRFLWVDTIGGFLWISSMVWAGFFLGRQFEEKQLPYVLGVIMVVSFLPLIIGVAKELIAHRKEVISSNLGE